ncbi:hypothetical protein BST27_26265 [Mycobacterium intermedium]|uniref:DUF4232 domain-containing protein n=1 Tax=Mycobacterium intermedium TaxID=28445 RepID=A0A1E3SIK9_MYCIE|nr:hypothetical protein [Mycobacterium intermedium]MCV6963275.1 hypothetical protein [Mycobacterium intermedium]ODR01493.1 hypothetical protein BHQ20_08355 [Mycobacterium intermedium]OPE47450.1 hypothetical protein BV508_22010 [Mycobacterium intermedium]ORA95960.1 hypothetical protein BST27_26265 [Mycobacterium intermedium]
MSVAAFVLGVVATVLSVASLSWQSIDFARRSPRPKLTPLVGLMTPHGLVTNDASADVREVITDAEGNLSAGPFIIGVKVVNTGRTPCYVDGWAVRAEPSGTSLVPVEKPIGGDEVPLEIPAGGSAIFITELQHARRFAQVAGRVAGQPPQIVLAVTSGARTYVTKPVASGLFSLGPDAGSEDDSDD